MKNKKRRVAIPLIIIAVCLCLIVVVTVFTTPVVYIIYENTYTYEDGETEVPYNFEANRKIGWITETVYKTRPTLYNLQIVDGMYNMRHYLRAVYYGNETPEGYVEKSLKYSKLLYETEYDANTKSYYAIPVGVDTKDYWKIQTSYDYMLALYVHGDIDEMKRVCDETITLMQQNTDGKHYFFANNFKDLFYLILAESKDEALKAWVLEKEIQINDYMRQSGKMEKFFTKYDSLYTNPDYDAYMTDNWPESAPGYYDYD